MKFLDDLNLSPDSKLVLIIAWKFKAAAQCEFSKDEFIRGMMDIGYGVFAFIYNYDFTLKTRKNVVKLEICIARMSDGAITAVPCTDVRNNGHFLFSVKMVQFSANRRSVKFEVYGK